MPGGGARPQRSAPANDNTGDACFGEPAATAQAPKPHRRFNEWVCKTGAKIQGETAGTHSVTASPPSKLISVSAHKSLVSSLRV